MVFTTPPARSQQESSPEAILLPIILIGYSIVKYIMTIDSFNNEKELIENYNKNESYLTQDEYYNAYRR